MKRTIIAIVIFAAMIAGGHREALAFWGSNSGKSASGLDVAGGYDVNTVTTVSGTVITPPARIDQSEHVQMTIATQQGTITALLGPWSYWERQGFSIDRDQEINITGSRAQGKDGTLYLFAQRVDNITNGTTITLRSESGSPMWSRSSSGSGNRGGQLSGRGSGGGSGYRGGGTRGGGRR